jgi:hypothetical protein
METPRRGELNEKMIEKIVSGGQTGADRAALDWALKNHLPRGGWCPKGRRAEDGAIPPDYPLTETPGESWSERTEANVRDSDGTAIFSLKEALSGGTLETLAMCVKYGKPHIHIHGHGHTHSDSNDATAMVVTQARLLREWILDCHIRVMNVAGPRASEEPEIGRFVARVLDRALLG